MNVAELTGGVRTHLTELAQPACALHVHAVTPFLQLRREAARDGIDLVPVSAFRDFGRQLDIWNAKYAGEKPVSDASGTVLETAALAPAEKVRAILQWSALPGASRHHWGTDIDVIDGNATPPGYRVQLTPAEFADGGPFARLSGWLEMHALRFGFFRPYRGVLSGVQAEAWHISFAPVAEAARRQLSVEVLRSALEPVQLLGKPVVFAQLDELHARYVEGIDWP